MDNSHITPDGIHDLRVTTFGFLLVKDFSLIGLSTAVDPLRIANMVVGRKVYTFKLLSQDGQAVTSSDGITVVAEGSIADNEVFNTVFVVGPNPIPQTRNTAITRWLHYQDSKGAALGGIDTGSYYLARAGLLDGYRCTIHWEDQDLLVERFPKLIVTNRLYEADRKRYTCSGGVAPLDLMVHLLSQPPGSRNLGSRVLELLVAEKRSHEQRQRASLRQYHGSELPKLEEALQLMESNMEEPLSIAELATYLAVSVRQLERWFHERLNKTPAQAYMEIRLLRARQLLYRTAKPLEEVCASTGFVSTTHFATKYKAQFQVSPIADRKLYGTRL
ncbi:GlxA family transcriptional regulator [Vogesella amnigena]|uniref:GlxA family transcriptional regulator n=1 Tax=Vogesella amnigena TaxID=1507449 RepID=A0ABV7TRI5_9NEIS